MFTPLLRRWTGLFAVLLPFFCRADAPWEYAVQITATVQASPPTISLSWVQDSQATPDSYIISRKDPASIAWGPGVTVSGDVTNFSDSNVTAGTAYEYQVVKNTSLGYRGFGYIYTGINIPLTDARGKLILLVDNTCTNALADALSRLQQDLAGDGWTVLRHDVDRNGAVTDIKNLIKSDYNADPSNVKALFLFGHVPVPYSGNTAADEHSPQHNGAWPADAYYGDMDGAWTDTVVSNTGADDERNWNVPGDGKFDQSYLPSDVDLMVGRVDLANMPGRDEWDGPATFPDEITLLRQYLDKDHAFRTKALTVPQRALIGDGFGDYYGGAFSASGWRSFAPSIGPDQIDYLPDQGTWLATLGTNSYLWTYGCGAGSYSTIASLGITGDYLEVTTPDVVRTNIHAVFAMLFGSWLGDWDAEDDIQRAVLATPTCGLACCWSGFPHWYLHQMGLGQPIGYSTRLTQNNAQSGPYLTQTNLHARRTHIALMGDPTLRLQIVAPPADLVGVSAGGIQLGWLPSPDADVGYHVYRSTNPLGPFVRLTDTPTKFTTYFDASPGSTNTYMVRAVKFETTPSGTFTNASEGVFVTMTNQAGAEQSLHVNAVSMLLGGCSLQWSAVPGARYRVRYLSGLTGGTWTDFYPDVIALGNTAFWIDPLLGNSWRFYKVVQVN